MTVLITKWENTSIFYCILWYITFHLLIYFFLNINYLSPASSISLSTSLTSFRCDTLGDHSLSLSFDDFHSETTPFINDTQHTENTFPFLHDTGEKGKIIKWRKTGQVCSGRSYLWWFLHFAYTPTYVHTHMCTPVISVLSCFHYLSMLIQQAK